MIGLYHSLYQSLHHSFVLRAEVLENRLFHVRKLSATEGVLYLLIAQVTDAVAQARQRLQDVRGKNNGFSPFPQSVDNNLELLGGFQVDPVEGLVEDEYEPIQGQDAHEGQLFLHAGGVLFRILV